MDKSVGQSHIALHRHLETVRDSKKERAEPGLMAGQHPRLPHQHSSLRGSALPVSVRLWDGSSRQAGWMGSVPGLTRLCFRRHLSASPWHPELGGMDGALPLSLMSTVRALAGATG